MTAGIPLNVEYDPMLIALSVVVAIIGSYGGLRAVRQIEKVPGVLHKVVFAAAALAIGISIWSMHFIGMLAVRLPVQIDYNVLITLISALVSILMTGIGLTFAVYGKNRRRDILSGGVLMGLGISCMHYIGMAAIRANCVIHYSPGLLIGSVAVGIAASVLAVWLLSQRGRSWSLALAALTMGLAISGMHYTAMAAATFLPIDMLSEQAQVVMQSSTLALGVAVSAFLVVGFAVLCALPARGQTAQDEPIQDAPADSPSNLPVERNKKQVSLNTAEIVAVKAEGHYTVVYVEDGQYFCAFSISKIQDLLSAGQFLRVHRSYFVNLAAIESFEKNGEQGILNLRTREPMAVPVSRSHIGEIRGALEL
ncbi:MAG: MHYT domain-containing protein [Pseudomonadota bacterium]